MPIKKTCITRKHFESLTPFQQEKIYQLWKIFGYIPCQEDLEAAFSGDPGLALILRAIVDKRFFKTLNKMESYEKYLVSIKTQNKKND